MVDIDVCVEISKENPQLKVKLLMFSSIPLNTILEVIHVWLLLKSLAVMDSAMCNHEDREHFLYWLAHCYYAHNPFQEIKERIKKCNRLSIFYRREGTLIYVDSQ